MLSEAERLKAMNPFNRKKFVAAAEVYLTGRRQKWLDSIKGTPLEAVALKLARQDWILDTEGLEAIRIENLFPDVSVQKVADSIESGTPESEAKVYIANLASRNLKDVVAELARLEDDMRKIAAPETVTPNNDPPLPVGEPPLSGEVRGYVAEVKHSPVIKHTIEIDKHLLYTFDKSLSETAKAAKSQKIHLLAVWTVGEFGCRLETLKPIDPPKPVEEIIP